MARVPTPIAGTVARLHVREGQRVLAGSLLAEVHATREGAGGDVREVGRLAFQQRQQALEQTRAAEVAQWQGRRLGLEAQARDLRLERALLDAQLQAQRGQWRLATGMLERMRQLRGRQYVSDIQVAQQEALVLEQEAAVLSARRQAASLERALAQVLQSQSELPGQALALRARADREAALLAAERAEAESRNRAWLRAPVAGRVGHLDVRPGQAVADGEVLLGLVPAVTALEAQLLVPASAMGLVRPGDRVQLRFHAYPYQDHGHPQGRVVRVTGSALAAQDGSGQALFRVVVALDRQWIDANGTPRRLRPGLTLDADVLGERRRLWEWALLPVRRLATRLSDTVPATSTIHLTSEIAGQGGSSADSRGTGLVL